MLWRALGVQGRALRPSSVLETLPWGRLQCCPGIFQKQQPGGGAQGWEQLSYHGQHLLWAKGSGSWPKPCASAHPGGPRHGRGAQQRGGMGQALGAGAQLRGARGQPQSDLPGPTLQAAPPAPQGCHILALATQRALRKAEVTAEAGTASRERSQRVQGNRPPPSPLPALPDPVHLAAGLQSVSPSPHGPTGPTPRSRAQLVLAWSTREETA